MSKAAITIEEFEKVYKELKKEGFADPGVHLIYGRIKKSSVTTISRLKKEYLKKKLTEKGRASPIIDRLSGVINEIWDEMMLALSEKEAILDDNHSNAMKAIKEKEDLLNTEAKEKADTIQHLTNTNEEYALRITEITTLLDSLQTACDEKDNQLAQFKEENERLHTSQIEAGKAALMREAALNKENESQRQITIDLTSQLNEASNKFDASKAHFEQAMDKMQSTHSDIINEKQSELDELKKKVIADGKSNAVLTGRIEELERFLDELREQVGKNRTSDIKELESTIHNFMYEENKK